MKDLVLIAGATGYVGGELLKKVLAAGQRVRSWRGVLGLSERRCSWARGRRRRCR